MSQRNPPDEDDSGLLDAARACVMDFGVRRTTLTDVARRAGVSRMTVYRHYPDVTSVIAALMTRDFTAAIVAASERAEGGSARERLVDETCRAVGALVDSPLFQRILDVDPELVLPYLTVRRGGIQRLAVARFATLIAEGQADHSIRAGDPEILASAIELTLRGYVFASGAASAGQAQALGAELRMMLDGYLRPDPAAAKRSRRIHAKAVR